MNMTQTATQTSQVIIKTSATASTKFELKTVSLSTSIGVKTNSSPVMRNQVQASSTTNSTTSPFERRASKWSDEEYRQGYLEGSIEQGIAWQIRANRKIRGLTQGDLGAMIGTTQSGVSRLEDPSYGEQSLDTLVRLAHAFDCALSVKFISYSQLAENSVDLREETMVAAPFADEYKELIGARI